MRGALRETFKAGVRRLFVADIWKTVREWMPDASQENIASLFSLENPSSVSRLQNEGTLSLDSLCMALLNQRKTWHALPDRRPSVCACFLVGCWSVLSRIMQNKLSRADVLEIKGFIAAAPAEHDRIPQIRDIIHFICLRTHPEIWNFLCKKTETDASEVRQRIAADVFAKAEKIFGPSIVKERPGNQVEYLDGLIQSLGSAFHEVHKSVSRLKMP